MPANGPALGPKTLDEASFQRLREALVNFHEFRAGNHQLAVSLGRQGNPGIARLQPRVDRVADRLTAKGYSPSSATEADGILCQTGTPEQLTEFERRWSRWALAQFDVMPSNG